MADGRFTSRQVSGKVWILLWLLYKSVEQPAKAGPPFVATGVLAGKAKQQQPMASCYVSLSF